MFDWWLRVAYGMDAVRLWPRVFVSVYLWQLYRVIEWYIMVCQPKTWDIAAFVTAYSAFCVPLLKWYMDSGVDWTPHLKKWRYDVSNNEGST